LRFPLNEMQLFLFGFLSATELKGNFLSLSSAEVHTVVVARLFHRKPSFASELRALATH